MTRRKPNPSLQRHINAIYNRSLTDLWRKIDRTLELVPEGADLGDNKQAAHLVQDVWAIEEEWILDPDRRAMLSMVQCVDKDPGDDDNGITV
jgi:hypothetical protein